MTTLTALCVFCGSSAGADPAHAEAAGRLGGLMAEAGVRLVYGGGGIGLMGTLARAVLAGGGEAYGVIPQKLMDLEIGLEESTELLVVDSMHARKQKMFDMADAFAVLAGGIGTLDETLEMLTWAQLGYHRKPLILLDGDGYWSGFRQLVDHVIAEGFAPPRTGALMTAVERVEEILPTARELLAGSADSSAP